MPVRRSPLLLAPLVTLAAGAQSPEQLMQMANQAYAAKAYAKAAACYQQVFEKDDQDPSPAYNAACCHALLGHSDAAFLWLGKALQGGFAQAENTAKDEDLKSLHPDARWAPLLEGMRRREIVDKTFWDSPALTSPFQEQLGEDERIAALSRFWTEVKFNFWDPERLVAIDWDGLYLKALPRVRTARSTFETYQLLSELCAKLQDGHTNVYAPEPIRERFQARPALRTRLVEGRVMVLEVGDPALRAQGFLPGVEITTVNGRPVKTYAGADLAPTVSASTPQDLENRIYGFGFLMGPKAEAPTVGFLDAAGQTHTVQVPRLDDAARKKALTPLPPFTFQMLPGQVAYVALNSFNDDTAAKAYLAAFPEISKAKALILDVRANGGGSSSVGYQILATLGDKPTPTGIWSTRDYKPTFRAWGRPSRMYRGEPGHLMPDAGHHFAGPVAVLTSPGTYSAAEDFAVAFDGMNRGLLIGEPTGGSTGQPLPIKLPGGGFARICSKRDTYPDGKVFVGVGVQPHRLVRPTVADLRAGRDTVLEAALAALRQ